MKNTSEEPDAPKPKGTWGGRRKGAGAPKGNLNALKHGRRSRQVAKLAAALASVPETHAALIALAERHDTRRLKAEDIALAYLERLLQHAEKVARGDEPGRRGTRVTRQTSRSQKREPDFAALLGNIIGDLRP